MTPAARRRRAGRRRAGAGTGCGRAPRRASSERARARAGPRPTAAPRARAQGFSTGWWKAKHNTHHAAPNELAPGGGAPVDPDIDTLPLLAWSEGMLDAMASPAARRLLRAQQYYFVPILMLARLAWAQQSAAHALGLGTVRGCGPPPPSPPGQAAATAPCCSPALARSARREALPCRAPACLPIHIALQDIRSCLSQTHWMRRSGCRGGIPLGSAQGALGLTRDRRPGTGGGRVGGAGAAGAALRLDGRPRVCVPGARAGHRLPAARAGVRALPSPRAHRRTCTQAAPVWQAACQDTGLDDAGEGHAQRQLCVLLRPSGAGLAGWS